MSKYHISRRLQFIIQYVYDKKYASKEELIDFLMTKDFNISERTLERDLRNIRTDFGIELSYNKGKNKYFIDQEKSVKVESFFKFLELVALADVFTDGLKDSHKILDYVTFDDSSKLKGIENLEIILIAIKQDRKLHFTHHNYYNNTHKPYTVTPLIIKEYINRWYVIGVPDGLEEIRTFGIDRMSQIELDVLTHLNKGDYRNQLVQFDKIIGLNYSSEHPQHIVLKVNNHHINYLKSLPLHTSQQIHDCEDADYKLVSYDIIPNYEFEIQILKMSMEVEVVAPKTYRDKIKNIIKNIHNKYQDS